MIISASRRTDIPAFYSNWLMQRLRQSNVLVRNPFNPQQVSRVSLDPHKVDCIVFWTKNPAPLLPHLAEIERLGHHFVVQYTLNAYDRSIEQSVLPLDERLATFHQLAELIGPERVLWRFDPILFTRSHGPDAVLRSFAELAGQLRFSTRQCSISFLSLYAKCRRNMAHINLVDPEDQEKVAFVRNLSQVAGDHNIILKACCDSFLQKQCGLQVGRCIDIDLIAGLLGHPLRIAKDKGQRPGCGCATSIDIGAYDSCPHGCRYCYANVNQPRVAANYAEHHPEEPLLIGTLTGQEQIVERECRSCRQVQNHLFNSDPL